MTDPTTPTRDEAVPADERRIDLPNGYYLFRIRPSDMTCSLHMPDGLHVGNLLAQYAADFAAAMLASAPAPASGGVNAVAELDAFYQGWLSRWRARLASLSPAATPVSGAGGSRVEQELQARIDELLTEREFLTSVISKSHEPHCALWSDEPADCDCRASSPAGGDVLRQAADIVERLPWHNAGTIAHRMREAALSQSTSAGRGE